MAKMQKKMAAAVAAVNAYLQLEQSAAEEQSRALEPAVAPCNQLSSWSLSGRQDMMTMRRLMQLRTFAAFR